MQNISVIEHRYIPSHLSSSEWRGYLEAIVDSGGGMPKCNLHGVQAEASMAGG